MKKAVVLWKYVCKTCEAELVIPEPFEQVDAAAFTPGSSLPIVKRYTCPQCHGIMEYSDLDVVRRES